MKIRHIGIGSFLVVIMLVSASSAQVQRTFVSGLGSDGNACSRTAPCRTFGQAIMGTNPGGEVYVLDSAGFGPFTINKSVTIDAPQGVIAGISVFSGDGIDINAGASDTVILRGLTVNNQGSSGNGIVFNSGGTLHIESCVANGFGDTLAAGVAIIGGGDIHVKDTIARNNYYGISVHVDAGTVSIALDHVQLDANHAVGLAIAVNLAGATVKAAVRNSSMCGNDEGISVVGQPGVSLLDVESCLITNNSTDGIFVLGSGGGTGAASISNCTISHNTTHGFEIASPGAIFSRGNNTIIGNGANIGSLTPLAGQ